MNGRGSTACVSIRTTGCSLLVYTPHLLLPSALVLDTRPSRTSTHAYYVIRAFHALSAGWHHPRTSATAGPISIGWLTTVRILALQRPRKLRSGHSYPDSRVSVYPHLFANETCSMCSQDLQHLFPSSLKIDLEPIPWSSDKLLQKSKTIISQLGRYRYPLKCGRNRRGGKLAQSLTSTKYCSYDPHSTLWSLDVQLFPAM
jgi:hypothetical protein